MGKQTIQPYTYCMDECGKSHIDPKDLIATLREEQRLESWERLCRSFLMPENDNRKIPIGFGCTRRDPRLWDDTSESADFQPPLVMR